MHLQYGGFFNEKKVIKITLTLQDGVEIFTAQGDNRLSSTGLAISANITYGNGSMSLLLKLQYTTCRWIQ